MWGKRAYDWKTVLTLRWWAFVTVMSWSPMWIDPAVGGSRPAIIRRVVVFPQPEARAARRTSPGGP